MHRVASPNCGERRGGVTPRLVVLHYTAMDSCDAALDRLCDPAAEVSAHYLIAADGDVLSLVPEELRAWHAGAGTWGGCTDINSASIGIELDNDGRSPFPNAQMSALEALLSGVLSRWSIPPEGVIGHSDMAYRRKTDPGPLFDWRRLAQAGLSVWPDPPGHDAAPDPETFADALSRFGYSVDDTSDPALLAAFRARFRPEAAPFDARDVALAADLAARFPVDPRLSGP